MAFFLSRIRIAYAGQILALAALRTEGFRVARSRILPQPANLEEMLITSAQQAAIIARGNVLVVAGAGTGKTSTLVERCMNLLLEENPRASLDEILIVTFTDAAAAEVRKRIRERLEKELEQSKPNKAESNTVRHLQEQLALFET